MNLEPKRAMLFDVVIQNSGDAASVPVMASSFGQAVKVAKRYGERMCEACQDAETCPVAGEPFEVLNVTLLTDRMISAHFMAPDAMPGSLYVLPGEAEINRELEVLQERLDELRSDQGTDWSGFEEDLRDAFGGVAGE